MLDGNIFGIWTMFIILACAPFPRAKYLPVQPNLHGLALDLQRKKSLLCCSLMLSVGAWCSSG